MRKFFIIITNVVVVSLLISCGNNSKQISNTINSESSINSNKEDTDLKCRDDKKESNKQDTKKQEVSIEGNKETIDTEIFKSNFGYAISYDKNRFKFSNGEGVDSFMAPNPDIKKYPNVFLAVSKIKDYSLDETINGLILQSGQDGVPELTKIGKGKYNAKKFSFKEGNKYNSRVVEYYATEKNKTVYLIEINYFVEAEEGYGERLHSMLDTFQFL